MVKAMQTLILMIFLAVFVAACGRKGALQPPASAMITNENGDLVEKPHEEKPFILDRLIK